MLTPAEDVEIRSDGSRIDGGLTAGRIACPAPIAYSGWSGGMRRVPVGPRAGTACVRWSSRRRV
jgi:hypothetical protein